MAQLFRYLFTDDRQKSEIFTFMIPSSFLLDVENDLKSRDFSSSNQKWSLSFSKINDQMNVFLTLKSAYEAMLVVADYGITLINREHFTKNEMFVERQAKFSIENATQGRKSFVAIEALCTLDFMDERGNIQCELEIKNVSTQYVYDTQIPMQLQSRNPNDLKFISGTFAYGNYEWNIYVQPKLDNSGNVCYLKFYISRLSSLDHLCRINYRYKITNGQFMYDSGPIEQYSDINGASNSFRMDKIKELLQNGGRFSCRLEFLKINSVFPIILYPLSRNPQPVNFYDRDRQAWTMESCIEDNSFILRLFYTDINNIPSGYVRVMSFNISIRHQQTGPAYVFKKPVIKYYHKRESDDGLEISTTVDVNELTSPNNGYLDQDGGITIEMEWNYSHLLHQPEYSHLDDIIRKQKLQMQREIQTLQQENSTLEKQLAMQGGGGIPVGNQHKQFHHANSTASISSQNNYQTNNNPNNMMQNNLSSIPGNNQNPNMPINKSNQIMPGVMQGNPNMPGGMQGNPNMPGGMQGNPNMPGVMQGNPNMIPHANNSPISNQPSTPSVVRKYQQQKYGSNANIAGPGVGGPLDKNNQMKNGIPNKNGMGGIPMGGGMMGMNQSAMPGQMGMGPMGMNPNHSGMGPMSMNQLGMNQGMGMGGPMGMNQQGMGMGMGMGSPMGMNQQGMGMDPSQQGMSMGMDSMQQQPSMNQQSQPTQQGSTFSGPKIPADIPGAGLFNSAFGAASGATGGLSSLTSKFSSATSEAGGLSGLTSKFSSGLADLKNTATAAKDGNAAVSGLMSKFKNPFGGS